MDWQRVVTRRLGVALAVSLGALGFAGSALAAQGMAVGPAHRAGDPMHPFSRIGNDVVTSGNWSGYAIESSSKFTDAQGSWVEPTATCATAGQQFSSFWVGIDGYSSNSVEQLGTDSDCTGLGEPNYYAWYEMYPAGSVTLSPSTYPVHPGDTLTAEVKVTFSVLYTLTLHSSAGWTFTTTKFRIGLAKSSAELIAESPEICGLGGCSLASLADFGTAHFTGAQATLAGGTAQPFSAFTSASGPHEIIGETSTGTIRAQPSVLSPGTGGDSFSIAWEHL
jgi:hypothetical protein